jgi:hypothetical protein
VSLSKGSIAARIFTITEPPPSNFAEAATLAIRRYTFRPIDDSRGERTSAGWCIPGKPLVESFTAEEVCISHNRYLLGYRTDLKRIPPVIFKARVAERIAEVRREKRIEKLSRQHRIAVEEEVEIALLKQTSPKTDVIEVALLLNEGLVIIGTATQSKIDKITEMLEATFDMKLRERFPSLLFGQRFSQNPNASPLEHGQQYAAIGPDFLTHTMRQILDGAWTAPECEPLLTADIMGPLYFEGLSEIRKATFGGEEAAAGEEVTTALKNKKKLTRARLAFDAGEDHYQFTLDGPTFDFRAVKLPVPALADENMFLEMRIDALLRLQQYVEESFAAFAGTWKPGSVVVEPDMFEQRDMISRYESGPTNADRVKTKEFARGCKDFEDGVDYLLCPYELGSEAATCWMLGHMWKSTDTEKQQTA